MDVGAGSFLAVEQCVEEADEQVLVHLGAEELLESEVGVGVDVAFAVVVNYGIWVLDVSGCKNSEKLDCPQDKDE